MESLTDLKIRKSLVSTNSSQSGDENVFEVNVPIRENQQHKPKIQEKADQVQGKTKIEDQMNNENLEMLQMIFKSADEDGGGGLDVEEFRQAMRMAFGNSDNLDNKQLEIMFMKVDTNCDGAVDWEEFCSYMLLENQQKDSMNREFIDFPFPNPAREIPSPHHDTISKIAYFHNVGVGQRPSTDDASEDMENGNGRYVTCSKDGLLVFWGLDLQIQRTVNLTDSNTCGSKMKQVWITDIVCLANVKKIAVSSTERDVTFYDCSANNFERQFIVTGLDHCILCMDYWYDPRDLNHSFLILGDAGGSVLSIIFTQATVGLFDVSIRKQQNMSTSTIRRIPFLELVCGRHPNVSAVIFNNIHDDWVRKVKYLPNLRCFLSCANTSQTSLFLGDIRSKKVKSFFKIRKGVYTFDYEKESNVIVTGGLDRFIRLWSPYVTSKPTCVLKGHHSSVIHLIAQVDQIISLSKDKVVMVWDARDHCCVQTIPSHLTDIGSHPVSSVLYNRKLQTLLLGSNALAVLEKKNAMDNITTDDEIKSHPKPLCAAIYNDLFNQVVSACHGSVVNVWHVDTGEKVIMFANTHDGDEITAMSFDPTKRRLITGSRNGTVKIWNFNNGACLRSLSPIDDGEVTGIVCPKQRIVTVGWNHKITVYRDVRGAEDDPPKLWNSIHKDDILAVDFMNSGYMATASYDGQVTCWSLESGHIYCQMNMNKTLNIRSPSVNSNCSSSTDVGYSRKHNTNLPPRTASKSNPTEDINMHVSVDKIFFLKGREGNKQTATLLVGVDGIIQAWSIQGGLLGQFDAIGNETDESVLAITSDEENHILLTGDSLGYIKIWDISNYCLKERVNSKSKVGNGSRYQSPLDAFTKQRSSSPGGNFSRPVSSKTSTMSAKPCVSRASFDTLCPPPACITAFRGHSQSIVSIELLNKKQLIVTASTDCSVRLWTINGKYIGTFGQKQHWESLENPDNLKCNRKIPTDLQRVASSETMKVICGTTPIWKLTKNIFTILNLGRRLTKARVENDEAGVNEMEDETAILSRPHPSLKNILGRNYKAKQRHRMPPNIRPKINHLQCVAFSSLPFNELEPIAEPKMPPVLTKILGGRQQQQGRSLSPSNTETRWKKKGLVPIRNLTVNRILPMVAFKK